eukprot:scaffold27997_cov152-Isochrysis_galbana.AAC.1
MREGVQAFDAIIVITREAIQATLALARKCPPAQMQAVLQEEIYPASFRSCTKKSTLARC